MTGRVLGAVLAGGASSRFGSDKALAVVDGRTLLDHALAALAEVADGIVVVGRAGGIPDLPIPGLGPLGGIAGALDHTRREGFASVVTIGCDMPRMPRTLLSSLIEQAPGYCADAPVMGHWPAALADDLLRYLAPFAPSLPRADFRGRADPTIARRGAPSMPDRARHEGGLSVRRWAHSIGAVAIPSSVPLANVNTPADLPR